MIFNNCFSISVPAIAPLKIICSNSDYTLPAKSFTFLHRQIFFKYTWVELCDNFLVGPVTDEKYRTSAGLLQLAVIGYISCDRYLNSKLYWPYVNGVSTEI